MERLLWFDRFDGWVESFEFDSGVRCGELPVDLHLLGIASLLPGRDFGLQCGQVGHPAVEALSLEDIQFDLRHVEPTATATGCDQESTRRVADDWSADQIFADQSTTSRFGTRLRSLSFVTTAQFPSANAMAAI